MSARRWWAPLALWLALGGCGGAQLRGAAREPSPAAGQTTAAAEEERGDTRRAEIERLERDIQARTTAVPPPAEPAAPGANVSPPPMPGVARPGQDDALMCEQACQATGSICHAAQRICTLAAEMDDDWARGRCRAATRTCSDTRRRATDACGTC